MSDVAVRFDGVGKMYKIFSSRRDNLLDALGAPRLLRREETRYRAFWALREIDLTLARGKRVGVIGRNGAGKTTLLRLVTGDLAPTEGAVEVNGAVQALIEIGTTFHPEFTGLENIRATLSYHGLSRRAVEDAVEDISDFTELGEFLGQPIKSYSLGMKARLAFATATAALPEILVIDEVLGAGDAYFIAKSLERMRRITDSGASMLIVSHSMAQITQLCEQTIWIDRGRIAMSGPSLDVVKAYERHIRELDDRRIRERNSRRLAGATDGALERPDLALVVRFAVAGRRGAGVDLSDVRLLCDGLPTDAIEIGAPHDVEQSGGAFVVLGQGSDWSSPRRIDGRYTRSLTANADGVAGSLAFNLFHVRDGAAYELEVDYRPAGGAAITVETWQHGVMADSISLPVATTGDWKCARIALPGRRAEATDDQTRRRIANSHWPAEGSLRISDAQLTDARGRPCAVFERGGRLQLSIFFQAKRAGRYRFLPCVVIYRLDGVNVSTQLDDWMELELEPDRTYRASTTLDDLNLGNGTYLASAALYKSFDEHLVAAPVVFDWIDRSVEFQVVGTPPAIASVFRHASSWTIDAA